MIGILIPCFNGRAHIAEVVRGARPHGCPIWVVNDGSSDDSKALALAAGATVLDHDHNRGKGAALKTGFDHALGSGCEAVLTLDADGQHNTQEIPAFLAAHRSTPQALIIGTRSFDPRRMPLRSRIGNAISTWWISRFAGRRHRDTQSGYRLYPRALLAVPIETAHFETETELLLRAAQLSIPLVELPIETIYPSDHTTHFRGFADTWRVLTVVLKSPFWKRAQ